MPKLTILKHTIITLLISFAITIPAKSQNVYTFTVDQTSYKVEEQVLNDLFGAAFSDLVSTAVTTDNNFSLWVKSYDLWKLPALRGTFNFNTYGERIANISFTGEVAPMYLGFEKPGKSAKGNPNKKDNFARRFQLLNFAIGRQIIYYTTKKVVIN